MKTIARGLTISLSVPLILSAYNAAILLEYFRSTLPKEITHLSILPIKEDTLSIENNIQPNEETVSPNNDHCPLAIRDATGVFRNDDHQQGWERTVLVTAANYDYLDILQNWEYLAHNHNLKWAVLALDEEIDRALSKNKTKSRVVPTDPGYAVQGQQLFRQKGFNTLSCNKLRQVLHILRECKVDVIFSDCDNVFLQNPLIHDFGKLIQSRRYDYIYQVNDRIEIPRSHSCLTQGRVPREGNTGFYFMSHTNVFFQKVIEETLARCEEPKNRLDDQALFWNAFHSSYNNAHEHFAHCTGQEVDGIVGESSPVSGEMKNSTARLCCLGWLRLSDRSDDYPENDNPITYHANYAVGKGEKIVKLMNARKDGYGWNASRLYSIRDAM